MKNTPLTGYLLHARPYQERRAIYQFFSREHGVVHGVGVRGMPSFTLMELFASGQSSLKNFSQICPIAPPNFSKTLFYTGQTHYARLYLNELIVKLIAQENPCQALWHNYHDSVQQLSYATTLAKVKTILRAFERVLFDELGVAIDWTIDSQGRAIMPEAHYHFVVNVGFVQADDGVFAGSMLLTEFERKPTKLLGQIHRRIIDDLLAYQPLNSRKLWAEQLKYHFFDMKEIR